jgi:DNA primase
MSIAEDIKSRLDIVAYIQQTVPLRKAGRTYKAPCPFHSEKTPSFVVNAETQTWRCFGACAEGGDIFSFAMKRNGWSFSEALEALGALAGVEVKKQSPQQKQREDHLARLRSLLGTAAQIYHKHLVEAPSPDAEQVLGYALDRRGLTEDTLRRFEIGYAPPGWRNMLDELLNLGYDEALILEAGVAIRNEQGRVYDRFRSRLMIPIRDERGRVIGFGARALDPNDNPKYLNSPQTPVFDKSQVLFALDAAKSAIRETETAVIVEGYMDAIQAHQAGFNNVVAQMGTAMTEHQIRLIAPRYARKIVLALDADAAGQNATRRSLETARQTLAQDYGGKFGVEFRILQSPDAKDPDDLIRESPEKWRDLVDVALPVADYMIRMETAGLNQNASVQEREALARRVLPLLTASENALYTQDNLQKLALRVRISERDLLNWAKEQKAQPAPARLTPAAAPADVEDDGPPPLDLRWLEAPEGMNTRDQRTAGNVPAHSTATPHGRTPPVDSAEAHCIRLLLRDPEAIYQINRRLRELVGAAASALGDFGAEDFITSEYRQIMLTFLSATRQHDLDVQDYMESRLDAALHLHFEHIRAEEPDRLRQSLRERYTPDLADVMKKSRLGGLSSPAAQVMEQALRLRLRRVKRELDDLMFMQRDAQNASDHAAAMELGPRIALFRRAKEVLDAELNAIASLISK